MTGASTGWGLRFTVEQSAQVGCIHGAEGTAVNDDKQAAHDALYFTRHEPHPKYDHTHVRYWSDGKGKWWKTVWQRQCPEGVFLAGRCQGVEGHKGVHWRYSPCGSLRYVDNANDPSENGGSGSIPPGHKHYKPPAELQKLYFMNFKETTEVTESDEIARLERDEVRDGESLDRPYDPDKERNEELKATLRERRAKSKNNKAGPPKFG